MTDSPAGFDKTSELIGRTINQAFLDLFDKLTAGDNQLLADSNLTRQDLDEFLSVVGGAFIDVNISSRLSKGTKTQVLSKPFIFVPSDLALNILGSFEGSCGGTWRF
ncbi:MAG: hypothetical protein ACK5RA_04220 [Cyanobacteriota bacterium]